MQPYQKPYLSVAGQLAQLQSRGIIVTDKSQALDYLKQLNYYRLSAYWYPFRVTNQSIVQDQFKPDTHFQTVIDLYLFDKKLRLLMLDALESIEIALRTAVVLQLGQYDSWAYRNRKYLDGKFVKTGKHTKWLQQFDDKAKQSHESFAEHFRNKYPSSDFPIWMAVELLDFGSLSYFLSGMRYSDQRQIACQYGIPRPDLLTSWVRTLCFVRNVCAHHARLWNRSLVNQPKRPRQQEIRELDHLTGDAYTRFYSAAAICRFLLKTIMPSSGWSDQLKTHATTFPKNAHVSFSASGFPNTWENELLWT
ncbi:Abi family protein [Nostoc sp. CCCryo 231-06]|nr:Abi family protein [Nostoc sp. CCCryo 231-06]